MPTLEVALSNDEYRVTRETAERRHLSMSSLVKLLLFKYLIEEDADEFLFAGDREGGFC